MWTLPNNIFHRRLTRTRDQRMLETSEQGSHNLFRVHSLNFYLLLRENFLAATRTPRASLPVAEEWENGFFFVNYQTFLSLTYPFYFVRLLSPLQKRDGTSSKISWSRFSRFRRATLIRRGGRERENSRVSNSDENQYFFHRVLRMSIVSRVVNVCRQILHGLTIIHVRIWIRCIFVLMKSSWWNKLSRLNETKTF